MSRNWRQSAACLGMDPELFFPAAAPGTAAYAAQSAEAISVCAGCPVRVQCLADALGNGIAFGVWGGLSEEQRKLLPAQTVAVTAGAPDLCLSGRHLKSGPGRCSACRKEFDRKREAARERDQAAVYARRVARGAKGIAA